MNIYIICPVRQVTDQMQAEIDMYVEGLKEAGHSVHNPRYDVNQDDETGFNICFAHREAMEEADRVDIFWMDDSFGSHFDLGMAFMARADVRLIKLYKPDKDGKSFVKVIKEWEENN